MKIMVILQNAYGVEDGYIPSFNRQSFCESYSGKRLAEMLPTLDVFIRNASPLIGKTSASLFKPDIDYLKSEIKKIKPDTLLVCGKQARMAIEQLKPDIKNIIFAPHPAWRKLSKKHTQTIREALRVV